MGESERNEQQNLPASHQHPLQSCHSPAPHKRSHCRTISCGRGYKVYHSPAAVFTLASCKDSYLYSSDGFHLVVFVFWRATLGVNAECLLQSKMMNSVEELQRKQPAAKIQRLVEFEQITRLTSVKFSVPVTEDSSY